MTWTTRPRFDIGGLTAIVEGTGPQIVMLHGVGLRAEAWGAQIDACVLAGYRVVAPDMLGHGESTGPAPDNLQGFTRAFADLLDQSTLVIGHSMGAMMALDLAVRAVGVVAMNAVYRRDDAASAAVKARAEALDSRTIGDPGPTLRRWFGTDQTDERTACETWLRATDPAAYKSAYSVFANSDGPNTADLEKLRCPALFLTGAKEPNSTPAMSHAMAGIVSNGRAEIIDRAAHMMPMTHPEIVNAAVLDFAATCFSKGSL